MNEIYDKYITMLNQSFSDAFDRMYKPLKKSNRTRLLPHLPHLYRRWYYSALMPNTYLSPANIIESLNYEYKKSPNIATNVHLTTPLRYTGLSYASHEYSKKIIL